MTLHRHIHMMRHIPFIYIKVHHRWLIKLDHTREEINRLALEFASQS